MHGVCCCCVAQGGGELNIGALTDLFKAIDDANSMFKLTGSPRARLQLREAHEAVTNYMKEQHYMVRAWR